MRQVIALHTGRTDQADIPTGNQVSKQRKIKTMENITQDIIDNNKLIAEFMGGKYAKDLNYAIGSMCVWLPDRGEKRVELLKYHKSWDWLMPVIETILYKKDAYAQKRHNVRTCISPNMQVTYKAAVEFIKWYNEQKP